MKRGLYQVVRDYENEMIGLAPLQGGPVISIVEAIERNAAGPWVGLPETAESGDTRVAQVVIEIREHPAST